MQWRDTDTLPGVSITFVPTSNVRRSVFTMKKNGMLKNYIQY